MHHHIQVQRGLGNGLAVGIRILDLGLVLERDRGHPASFLRRGGDRAYGWRRRRSNSSARARARASAARRAVASSTARFSAWAARSSAARRAALSASARSSAANALFFHSVKVRRRRPVLASVMRRDVPCGWKVIPVVRLVNPPSGTKRSGWYSLPVRRRPWKRGFRYSLRGSKRKYSSTPSSA